MFNNPPSRFEIEKFANEKFEADLERRIDEYARKQTQALAQVRSRGNIGGYLPALIQCKQEKLRAEILVLADAWVGAGTIYAVPLPVGVEKALEKAAAEMTAGTVSALCGELDLMAKRTRIPQNNITGNREIESAMKSALREGKLRLKTQRIQAERSLRAGFPRALQGGGNPAHERRHTEDVTKGAKPIDSATWHNIREDFESLPQAEWSLIWTSRPPVAVFMPIQLQSRWTWFHPTHASLRARASAIFLKGAKARGYDSEDQWLDELRYADFVEFRITGHGTEKLPDGTLADSDWGILKDAVNHSITLCHQLEAGSIPKPIIGRLPIEAIARMEAATAAFMAKFVPKWERKVRTLDGKPDRWVCEAKLLRGLVIHHFETAAREGMMLCASVGEFVTELRAGVARFVHFSVGQYRWLDDAMRNELDTGFTFFVMRANPWAGIPEAERESKWHVGAITGEALAHTALKLMAEATARAASRSEPGAKPEPATERTVSLPQLPNRAAWLTAKLAEREWSKHDLQRHGGPEHRTTQKIQDGSRVQEDILRKVTAGLNSKPTHKGRELPGVVEADIPND
jgi:hypothetical protein